MADTVIYVRDAKTAQLLPLKALDNGDGTYSLGWPGDAEQVTLLAVKAKTDLIPEDITTQLDTNVPAIKAKTDLIGDTVGDASGDIITSLVGKLGNMYQSLAVGKASFFEKSITSPANAGDVTVATVTDKPCQIESVVIHANGAQTADLTSCGVFGGASKVITFISATDAVQANLNAADKQVAWTGVVRLAATKTIVISLVGTGATAVNLTVVIKYRPTIAGGYLA
jgi:hypothetical protein